MTKTLGLIPVIIIIFLMIVVTYLNWKLEIRDDHIAEERIESFIEDITGENIDLTPLSYEKD